jgi:hypothetical protein
VLLGGSALFSQPVCLHSCGPKCGATLASPPRPEKRGKSAYPVRAAAVRGSPTSPNALKRGRLVDSFKPGRAVRAVLVATVAAVAAGHQPSRHPRGRPRRRAVGRHHGRRPNGVASHHRAGSRRRDRRFGRAIPPDSTASTWWSPPATTPTCSWARPRRRATGVGDRCRPYRRFGHLRQQRRAGAPGDRRPWWGTRR